MVEGLVWQNHLPEQLLQARFHITTGFHVGQRDIIERLVRGERVLAIQHTGWGKSLCYQLAGFYHPHLTLVFSPLKALMRDQCQRCNDVYAIPAAVVSSEFPEEENRVNLLRAVEGSIKILFIAPERLGNLSWQEFVRGMRISMVVIDEAHCISTWGHDFRPHYRRIVQMLGTLPAFTAVLALTATANRRIERDILEQIGEAEIIRGDMWRSNLALNVVKLRGDQEKLAYLAELLPQLPGTGVVYTATRADAELVAAFLTKMQIDADYYHAGREDEERRRVQEQWMSNGYKVVCATNALGMGIDKPDVRFVVHYHVPASPIHYYQEIGRAGRDGREARCVLLYDVEDLGIQRYFIDSARPENQQYQAVFAQLRAGIEGEYDLMRATGYAQKIVRIILSDLEERRYIGRDRRGWHILKNPGRTDFVACDDIRSAKESELVAMEYYVHMRACSMGYLAAYLGDTDSRRCGICARCQPEAFPLVIPAEGMRQAVAQFLDGEYLPRIQKVSGSQLAHEAGCSLAYHGNSHVGRLVRLSKYEQGGPFAEELVQRTVKVVREQYQLDLLTGVVSVPPTRSGTLVETFARRVAALLRLPYIPAIAKIRHTQEQKKFTNWVRKADNVKDAFAVPHPELIVGRTLLLIDDIHDSGYTLREVGRTLMRSGAGAVYPFTITRTLHSDNQ